MLKVYSHPDSYRISVNLNIAILIFIYLGYRVRVKSPVWFRGKGKVFLHLSFFLYPNRLPNLYHYRYSIIHIK